VRALAIVLLACLAAPGSAAPRPRELPELTPAMSAGVARLGALTLQLELGRWTVGALDQLIREARATHADPSARLAYLAEHFRGTPFEYESLSPPPPAGALRVRLDRFGCTSFVITMLALAGARDFEDFAENLARIRYWRSAPAALDSDPTLGNILDFAWEVFVDSAVRQGFAADITSEIARGRPLTPFRSRFTARQRGLQYDPHERLVIPRVHPDRVVTAHMLSQPDFARLDRSRIRTGDILLFTRVDPRQPTGEELLIGHAAVAIHLDGELYMMHATRDYVWRPAAGRDSPPIATGVYYGDPRREQLGVALATAWVADPRGQELRKDGITYHGYHRTQLRAVHDYMAGARFHGAMVLRPSDRPARRAPP
jgi:hemin uptake protein HemP